MCLILDSRSVPRGLAFPSFPLWIHVNSGEKPFAEILKSMLASEGGRQRGGGPKDPQVGHFQGF